MSGVLPGVTNMMGLLVGDRGVCLRRAGSRSRPPVAPVKVTGPDAAGGRTRASAGWSSPGSVGAGMAAQRSPAFRGRSSESELLDRLLDDARAGRSAVLVIRGEAGVGKTALMRHAARQASGLRTVEVEGVEAEMELAFAGIHQLCSPLLDGLDALPEPQQNALRVALGVLSGDAPDRFLVAVAVLNLLAETAEERPLLCLVDDAQWLDAASVQALGFVARRLLAERVAMILSLREPTSSGALDGLAEPDARALLSRAVAGRLDDRVRDRIIAETGGNPLALVELSQRMSPAERAGGFAPPVEIDLPSRLEEQYLRRVA